MLKRLDNLITACFILLFVAVPLILYPHTSELFEFNKMVVTYTLTIAITGLWITKMVITKRINFRRTLLDIPLMLFLLFQLLSTVVSIDQRTSLLGYYSRFHGGLLSSLSYALLYWAFVANIKKSSFAKIVYVLSFSVLLVSFYGVLQHLGIDKDIWVQDVQNRVFSTLGQPNWLAAWLVAFLPVCLAYALIDQSSNLDNKKKVNFSRYKSVYWISIALLCVLVTIYTQSRSGYLGLTASVVTFSFFSVLIHVKNKIPFKLPLITLGLFSSVALLFFLFYGTPWTPKLENLLSKSSVPEPSKEEAVQTPALETGGSSSVEIRKIVWKGALDIWKSYPILGTGVETFAFSYYQFRPVEHNLVSEWDFLYNKAHNEYLNFAANTGTLGLGSYITFAFTVIILFLYMIFNPVLPTTLKNLFNIEYIKEKKSEIKESKRKQSLLNAAFLAGFLSILVTNFFGFSVIPVALLFFLYPSFSYAFITQDTDQKTGPEKLSGLQIVSVILVSALVLIMAYMISKYWSADLHYAKGTVLNQSGRYLEANQNLKEAVKLSPNEAVFWEELSESSAGISVGISEQGNNGDLARQYALQAVQEAERALQLSPANVNIKRNIARNFIGLSAVDGNFMKLARQVLEEAVNKAPTEAKLSYNLALTYIRTDELDKAVELLQKTIEMKPDYTNAYISLGLVYEDLERNDLAKKQFEYVLENLAPDNTQAQRELNELSP